MRERKRNRKFGFNYNQNGFYFITSCTQNRTHHFGYVHNGVMRLNSFGRIAEKQWYWLAHQYPYVVLHAFVVMPNHIHGIIEINRSVIDHSDAPNVPVVGTGRDLSLQREQQHPIKIKSLSQLMGAYKTTTSKQIHLAGNTQFAWQRSFHDHIIQNNTAYWNIYDYIANNPKQWKEDCFFEFR